MQLTSSDKNKKKGREGYFDITTYVTAYNRVTVSCDRNDGKD